MPSSTLSSLCLLIQVGSPYEPIIPALQSTTCPLLFLYYNSPVPLSLSLFTDEDQRGPAPSEPREKGRFPLLAPGNILPPTGVRHTTSGHGVGMLSSWLHKEAVASRNSCANEAQNRLVAIVGLRETKTRAIKTQLEHGKATWESIVASIKAL